ncbi:MAG TPA: SGNH/GDSL hydrolase family protein [Herpetosiphonaceae bacterium]
MLFQQHQKIVFIGDSITDAGRRGVGSPYGTGYVNQVRSLLLARYPDLALRFVNHGVGGDTTRHLADRWERDVLAERPDWLVLMIGINDVWRSFGLHPHEAVPLPEYEAILRDLLDRTRAATGARLILMEPYMIEADRSVPMRRQMDGYGEVVGRLADQYAAVLVRTQAAFDAALAHSTPEDWADDQIHPNSAGHAIIALALLRAIGFEL